MASWTFILTDNSFTPLGEILNASDRQVALPLNKIQTASFKVRLDNVFADQLLAEVGYIKGYRKIAGGSPVLQYYGQIINAQEVADDQGQSIAINSAGQAWILAKRLAGKAGLGTTYGYPSGRDRALVFKDILTATDTESDTHIDFSATPSAASSVVYTAGPYKPVTDCLNDLALTLDGFDWVFSPRENWVAGALSGTDIATFTAAPVFGTTKPEALFEYGTGRKNVASYTRSVGRDTQLNRAYHNAEAGPDAPGFPTVVANDATSQGTWGLLEEVVQVGLLDNTLRQDFVNDSVAVRKDPRQVIEFQPHIDPNDAGRIPQFGVDYSVGDTVRARAAITDKVTGQEHIRFDLATRVWGISFAINSEGLETQTLLLAQE